MADTVTLSIDQGLATIRMSRKHGNAINVDLVEDLTAAARRAGSDPAVRGVLFAAEGKLFCPGLDLQELIALDRAELGEFMSGLDDCVTALYELPKPMVAALHGHALAGGCVLSLTADWRVLREGALIGLNEVRAGLPLPFAVSMVLRESISAPRLEEVALFGRNYADQAAVASGLAHETHPAEGFETHCRVRLEQLAGKGPLAFSHTKRYLRAPTVERMRARDPRFLQDFLDTWYSEDTQARLGRILAQLRSK